MGRLRTHETLWENHSTQGLLSSNDKNLDGRPTHRAVHRVGGEAVRKKLKQ